jgi:hypothetical protein
MFRNVRSDEGGKEKNYTVYYHSVLLDTKNIFTWQGRACDLTTYSDDKML